MKKEKVVRNLNVKVQPKLFDKFSKKCSENYKTVSEVIRELMNEYIKEEN